MRAKLQSNTLSTGLAMFSMFFGAGNIVFPMAIGRYAQDQNFYAMVGLLISAVGVPFLGLMAMALFDGSYKSFFDRIGKVPGFLIALFIMALIGPFGALPRVIAFSYSTSKMFLGDLSLPVFSALSCLLIYLMTYKKSRILDILGFALTPVLLLSLAILVIKGLFTGDVVHSLSGDSDFNVFLTSLKEGYNTMDLLATFFFSSVVVLCLKQELGENTNVKKLVSMTLKASCIGAFLLAVVYVGISYVAAFHSAALSGVPKDELLGMLAMHILGPYAGIIAVIAVALACLTTAIALAAVFAEFLHEDITRKKLAYQPALILTLVTTFFMSTLHFAGIQGFLEPILIVIYPSLIVLSAVNLLYKLTGFPYVKTPVLATFAISLGLYLYNLIAA